MNYTLPVQIKKVIPHKNGSIKQQTDREVTESFSKIKLLEPQDANEKMNNCMMVNAHRTS